MSRATDPMALTHRAWRPRTYSPKPLSETARRRIHGAGIQPMQQPRTSRLWFWTQFAIYAACTAYALDLWIVK